MSMVSASSARFQTDKGEPLRLCMYPTVTQTQISTKKGKKKKKSAHLVTDLPVCLLLFLL